MPLLTEALTQLAKEKPDQPIEFVAKYLLDHNPEKSWVGCGGILNDVTESKILYLSWTCSYLNRINPFLRQQ